MIKNKLTIDSLLVIDDNGMPVAPGLRQLIDKDVRALYQRDKTSDKSQYTKECLVIYYLGDPKSPARQSGLSDPEALKMAIEQADLPKNYIPDSLVIRLIKRYEDENLTEAIPAYLCILAMPLFYSISEGISMGIISYVLLNVIAGKGKKVTPLMYVLAVLFVLKYIFL